MHRRRFLRTVVAGTALSLAGCAGRQAEPGGEPLAGRQLSLVATTTVHDSGLLDTIILGFERRFGATVDTVVRGTGAALRTAQDGDSDVVLVHARPLEDEFLRAGHGLNRRAVMANDFLVVGPPVDPAAIDGRDPVPALRRIAEEAAPFLSRGDRSGTNIRERRLWDAAGVEPSGPWYRETGQGMGNTLAATRELGGYTLTDRGTFLAFREDGDLAALVASSLDEPSDRLRNEYAAIPTHPARHDVAYPLAMAFVGYLTGTGQSAIDSFRVDDERAFRPIAWSEAPNFEQYVPSDWR